MSPDPRPWRDRLARTTARTVVRTLGGLPRPVQRLIAGRPLRIDGQELHVEAQVGMRLLSLAVTETFETLPLERGREQIEDEAWIFGYDWPVGSVEELLIPGPAGPIPARVYRPAGATGTTPGLVYLHGGGWVLGGLGSGDSVSRFLTAHAGVTVVSVDYRLAPEHPFPAGLDDVRAAFAHVVAHAAELGLDPTRIAIGGESAGGNLAAVAAVEAARARRDHPDAPLPAAQLLFMPVTDLSTKHPSYRLFSDGLFLTEAQMDWYRDHYLADPAQVSDPRVSPLLATDLPELAAHVAPALVAVAGFDVLRDEGEAYAALLAAAGVPVTLRRHAGITHGLVNATGVGRAARDTLLETAGALRVLLAPGRGSGQPDADR
ncbi:alpha/beta hydrolase [Nocardioides ferulae]|uniref:alpha/beta hydrolase n=1 Tax=Nocardioides ferulae TaxID=2340821 RepID=UPI000EB08C86|nr:alpha/beta hydrolase [Nocardioides ferulae]